MSHIYITAHRWVNKKGKKKQKETLASVKRETQGFKREVETVAQETVARRAAALFLVFAILGFRIPIYKYYDTYR